MKKKFTRKLQENLDLASSYYLYQGSKNADWDMPREEAKKKTTRQLWNGPRKGRDLEADRGKGS